MRKLLTCLFSISACLGAQAQADTAEEHLHPTYSLHGQATTISQYHPDFKSPYSGMNSLLSSEPVRASISATLFLNYHPARNTYLVFNPEIAGGKGLSKTLGIAGFPNGEVYRVGDPKPKPFIARLYIEQRFPFSSSMIKVPDDENQVAEKTHAEYLSILAGKFSLTDFFDNSEVSHDPRTQFMNWSLMGSGAWDYPANTRGYTMGAVLQAYYHDMALRTALIAVPIEANGQELQFRYGKAMGAVIEWEKTHLLQKNDRHFTTVHAGLFFNQANMGNYDQSIASAGANAPDITDSRRYGRTKWGWYASLDHHAGDFHWFAKTSWNDGQNETWAFTEIDRSIAAGWSLDGRAWRRADDHLGLAFVRNGISTPHRRYLAKGGYGFLIGDGTLDYGGETILETYYSLQVMKWCAISPDIQYVCHPAYNRDRGPVIIFSLRLHANW
ncbi:MAG TPA: carbohydrate porin [Sediminibacterium sp.]|nr:carbohydrate porin [Sediminibacterium sp.]